MAKYPVITHTFQTWAGMVLNNGAPAKRGPPLNGQQINQSSEDSTGLPLEVIQRCIMKGTLPSGVDPWLRNCIIGMTQNVSIADIKKIVISGQRLDMEEAVSLVMSMLGRPVAAQLVQHLHLMVDSKAYIWTDRNIIKECHMPMGSDLRTAFLISGKMANWALLKRTISDTGSPKAFLQALKAIRRSGKHKQTLLIPSWVFEYAEVAQVNDVPVPEDSTVAVSKKAFRVLQRWLNRARSIGLPDAKQYLRKQTEALLAESEGRLAVSPNGRIITEHMAVLMATEDPFALAYSFLVLQRRLQ